MLGSIGEELVSGKCHNGKAKYVVSVLGLGRMSSYSLFKLSDCRNSSGSPRKFVVYMLKFLPLMPISLVGGEVILRIFFGS